MSGSGGSNETTKTGLMLDVWACATGLIDKALGNALAFCIATSIIPGLYSLSMSIYFNS